MPAISLLHRAQTRVTEFYVVTCTQPRLNFSSRGSGTTIVHNERADSRPSLAHLRLSLSLSLSCRLLLPLFLLSRRPRDRDRDRRSLHTIKAICVRFSLLRSPTPKGKREPVNRETAADHRNQQRCEVSSAECEVRVHARSAGGCHS